MTDPRATDDVDGEPFQFTNPPPRPKRACFESYGTTQRVLIAGLDCLAGQLDLFTTDGPPAAGTVTSESTASHQGRTEA